MKTHIRSSNRQFRFLTTAFAIALALAPSIVFAEGGLVDQSIDALYNLRDQNQANALKSVKGTAELMQDGPPPSVDAKPWTKDDLNQIRQKNANLLKLNNDLAHSQSEMFKIDQQLLKKLPPDDPRRKELTSHAQQTAANLSDTRNKQEEFRNKVGEANTAIEKWKQKEDPTYVPKMKAAPPKEAEPERPPPDEPPKTDDGGGGGNTGNSIDALKQKEAEQEKEARALGKQREAAVNKYLDDPSADNRAEAEAIKQKLDGMVEDLNRYRGQVDELDGTSRPPIHVKSAKAIAKQHRKNRVNGTNTDGTPTTPSSNGAGCGSSGTGGEQHNPDGSDVTGSGYQDVAPDSGSGGGGGGGGGAKGGGGRSQRSSRKTQSKMASSENHHHAAGTKRNKQSKTTSSGQYQRNAGGGNKSRNKQSMQQKKHYQQPQQQQQQQQQRKRKNKKRDQ
jgi:hypothetical protein